MGLRSRPGPIPALIRLLGGHDDVDVLALLAACHRRAGEQFSGTMSHPDVSATFSNWAQLIRGPIAPGEEELAGGSRP